VLSRYCRRYGCEDIQSEWSYVAALKPYREMSGGAIPKLTNGGPPYVPGRSAYIRCDQDDHELIGKYGLKVV
jgi:hypothetical protein